MTKESMSRSSLHSTPTNTHAIHTRLELAHNLVSKSTVNIRQFSTKMSFIVASPQKQFSWHGATCCDHL
ncbi:hypothetical protein Plhal304r1_c063g0150501 [Plasmopara halstedii]